MSGLGPVYSGGAPHGRGHYSATSEAAAKGVETDRLTRLQARVLSALRRAEAEGRTADELAVELDEYRYTIAPRLTELVRLGWIDDAKCTRPTPRGKETIVFVARAVRRETVLPARMTRLRPRLEQRVAALEKIVEELLAKVGGVQPRMFK